MGALAACCAPLGRYDKAKRPSARGQSELALAQTWRGRKEMSVSGGKNVYPAEIEQVLLSHPEVQDAAVLSVPDSKWGEVAAAYLVGRKQGGIAPEIILEFVNTRLARYKLPKEICFLDSLPRNASGEINKEPFARQVPLCGCSPILGDTELDLPADRSGRGTTRRSVED